MTSLFSQFYTRMTVSLILLIALLIAGVTLLINIRYKQHIVQQVVPVASLVAREWQDRSVADRIKWLSLVSGLTHTQWHTETGSMKPLVKPLKQSWSESKAAIQVQLDDQTFTTLDISNWTDWQRGYGWLVLNALSMQPAQLRESWLLNLNEQSPWPIQRINRLTENLSPLALRQLASGQAVHIPDSNLLADNIYLPAGASQAIRIGPVDRFVFLNLYQWLAIAISALVFTAVILALIVRPIQLRIEVIRLAVDRIADDQSDIQLPTQYQDDLGLMASHIEQMARRLTMQIEQNRQLNHAVSHDLKTPLARLKFLIEMARENPGSQLFDKMHTDIDLLVDLTNELLLFHQLQASKSTGTERTFAPSVINMVAQENQDEDCHIKVEVDPAMQNIHMSEAHFRRVCHNLVVNAVQYGDKVVKIALTGNERFSEFSVSDDGSGLSEEQFNMLKQPFTRGEQSRSQGAGSHGLGLSLVDALSRYYQGEFFIQKSELGGAMMVFRIPILLENTDSTPNLMPQSTTKA